MENNLVFRRTEVGCYFFVNIVANIIPLFKKGQLLILIW